MWFGDVVRRAARIAREPARAEGERDRRAGPRDRLPFLLEQDHLRHGSTPGGEAVKVLDIAEVLLSRRGSETNANAGERGAGE